MSNELTYEQLQEKIASLEALLSKQKKKERAKTQKFLFLIDHHKEEAARERFHSAYHEECYKNRLDWEKNVENIFSLFDQKIEGDVSKELSNRQIACSWHTGDGFCKAPATHVLPRPAIFVCEDHLFRWTEEVKAAQEWTEKLDREELKRHIDVVAERASRKRVKVEEK